MKVLMLNGSAKPNGNTNAALTEIGKELEKEGISYEIFQIGASYSARRYTMRIPAEGCSPF